MDGTGPETSIGVTHEIVARIQAGDAPAWDDLWARIHDDLLFAVRCRLGPGLRSHLESEDILQSVALEALRELPAFVPRSEGTLRHFLNVLATRKIRDRADAFGARKRAGTVPLDAAPATAPRYREPARYEALERALSRLDDDHRDVVILHRIDGLSLLARTTFRHAKNP